MKKEMKANKGEAYFVILFGTIMFTLCLGAFRYGIELISKSTYTGEVAFWAVLTFICASKMIPAMELISEGFIELRNAALIKKVQNND